MTFNKTEAKLLTQERRNAIKERKKELEDPEYVEKGVSNRNTDKRIERSDEKSIMGNDVAVGKADDENEDNDDDSEDDDACPVDDCDDIAKQRNRAMKVLDGSCMLKQNGYILLSKYAFDPEGNVRESNVRQILGVRALQLPKEDIKKLLQWFSQLKIHAGNFGNWKYYL